MVLGDHWGLTVDQQRTLLGVWANLEILMPNPVSSSSWMNRAHSDPRFGGHSPLAWMLQGTVTSLVDVRRYLESWRFGL